jgi:phosphate transport system substrate-binding protein
MAAGRANGALCRPLPCVPRVLLAMSLLALATAGCTSRRDDSIRMTGSDTMVGLAQAWAEAYQKTHPDISAQVRGGGSGVGIAALINGRADIAPSSRAMKEDEIKLAREKTGKEPREFIVGTDALAIYVHKDNPLESITIDQLAEIYGEGGKINTWQDLGVENAKCPSSEIIRISRQNNSGTYVYFRDEVLGKDRQYKQGTTAQSGSSDVVDLVGNTPCAMGYSGMGYADPGKVKMLGVAVKKGDTPVVPTITTALDGTYPLARPLYIYTLGEPTGAAQEFIQWMLGPEGQKIVAKVGYVPIGNVQEDAPSDADGANASDSAEDNANENNAGEEPGK